MCGQSVQEWLEGRVTATQADISLEWGTPITDGDHPAVEWWVRLTNGGEPGR